MLGFFGIIFTVFILIFGIREFIILYMATNVKLNSKLEDISTIDEDYKRVKNLDIKGVKSKKRKIDEVLEI